jgi:hypothetical protein
VLIPYMLFGKKTIKWMLIQTRWTFICVCRISIPSNSKIIDTNEFWMFNFMLNYRFGWVLTIASLLGFLSLSKKVLRGPPIFHLMMCWIECAFNSYQTLLINTKMDTRKFGFSLNYIPTKISWLKKTKFIK